MGPCATELYEENSKLCLAIKDHPCLYDRSHSAYLKKDASEEAWEAIANACCNAVSECKTRWRKIRSTFLRSISGDAKQGRPPNNREYYLSDVLQWFVPHIASLNDKSYESDQDSTDNVKNIVSDKPRPTRNTRCFSMVEGSIHALQKQMNQYEFADDEASKESNEWEGLDRRYNLRRACKRSLKKSPSPQPPKELEVKRPRRSIHQKTQEPTASARATINKKNECKGNSTEKKSKAKNPQGNVSQQTTKQELNLNTANANKQRNVLRDSHNEIEKPRDQGSRTRDTTPESECLNLHMSDDSSRSSNNDLPPEKEINSDKNIKDIELFFKSVTQYVTDMNARQLFNFKKKTYQALMEVFDDPTDFPLCDEVLVNPSPKSLIFDNVSSEELKLMRELASVIVSGKPNSNTSLVAKQTPSTPTPSPTPKFAPPSISAIEKPAFHAAPEKTDEVLVNSSEKQAQKPSQPVVGIASARQHGITTRQLLVPDQNQGQIVKVVRLNNKGMENCGLDGERRQYYRSVHPSTNTSKVVIATAGTKNSFNMTPTTFTTSSAPIAASSQSTTSTNPSASVSYRQLQGRSTTITPFSTNGSASTKSSITINGTASTNGSATNKQIMSLAGPAKSINMRRYSISGIVPSQLERRTPTKVGTGAISNAVNIVTSNGNVVSTRVPMGVQIKRAVRNVQPIATPIRADNAITTRTTNGSTPSTAAVPTTVLNQFAPLSNPPALSPLSSVRTLTSAVSQLPHTSTPIFVKTADVLNATPQYGLSHTNPPVPTSVLGERPRRHSMGILNPDFTPIAIKKEPVD